MPESDTITLVWTPAATPDGAWIGHAGEQAVARTYRDKAGEAFEHPWYWEVLTGDPKHGPCMFAKTRDEAMDAATEAWAEWQARPVATR